MCGRYSLYFFPDAQREFIERFGIPFPITDFPNIFNIPPGIDIPVVMCDQQQKPIIKQMYWGLIPSFAKEFKPHPKYKMSNTRIESLTNDSKKFRNQLIRTSRCIIPANNYFEWQGDRKNRRPYLIKINKLNLLSLGGIYSIWRDTGGRQYFSCSILTMPASPKLAHIHHRMPLILPGESVFPWLDPELEEFEQVKTLFRAMADDVLDFYPVSLEVNNSKNNYAKLVLPLAEPPPGYQTDLF